jgi:hypothetical protein
MHYLCIFAHICAYLCYKTAIPQPSIIRYASIARGVLRRSSRIGTMRLSTIARRRSMVTDAEGNTTNDIARRSIAERIKRQA